MLDEIGALRRTRFEIWAVSLSDRCFIAEWEQRFARKLKGDTPLQAEAARDEGRRVASGAVTDWLSASAFHHEPRGPAVPAFASPRKSRVHWKPVVRIWSHGDQGKTSKKNRRKTAEICYLEFV